VYIIILYGLKRKERENTKRRGWEYSEKHIGYEISDLFMALNISR
jgi:hypothetical protein